MKSARIRSFSGPYFLAFGLNTESKCGKVQTRKTLNTATFDAAGFHLTTRDSYFTILIEVLTNHILAKETYFTNRIE